MHAQNTLALTGVTAYMKSSNNVQIINKIWFKVPKWQILGYLEIKNSLFYYGILKNIILYKYFTYTFFCCGQIEGIVGQIPVIFEFEQPKISLKLVNLFSVIVGQIWGYLW